MRTALNVVRWLILVPAYLLLTAFCAAWVMLFFTHYPGIWRGHFDVVLFSCAVLASGALCLVSAWIAPSIKRLIGVLAAVASVVLTLNRWSLVLVTQGVTRPFMGELAAEMVGGLLAFGCLVLVHSLSAKRSS